MVAVCCHTGYIMAIPTTKLQCTSQKAAELYLEHCAYLMGIPKENSADNDASIIRSKWWDGMMDLTSIQKMKSIIHRPESNGRAERAVQSIVNALRAYLLWRGKNRVDALPMACWGLSDLPSPVAPYKPHRVVFGRDPIGLGDVPPITDADGEEDAEGFFERVHDEREGARQSLEATHEVWQRKLLKDCPVHCYAPGDNAWNRNRTDQPNLYPKLRRIWQSPGKVLSRQSSNSY